MTNQQRASMQMALEALEEIHRGNMTPMAEESWNKAITALREALAQPQEPVAHKWPLMGYGNVAIGGGINPGDGTPCLLYLDMGEIRDIDADTSDLFPIGSAADPEKLMACIRFKDSAAIQQTIDVLQEMQAEIGHTDTSASYTGA
jgi:hypothetical protein